jgi:protein-disulfide isomerase
LRAANAAGCAADEGKFLIFHDTVYVNQPKKEGTGYTDSDLLRFGNEAGLTSPSFAKCVTTVKYRNWVINGVQRAADNVPVTSTPTLRLNNRDLVRPISNQQIVNAIASLSK